MNNEEHDELWRLLGKAREPSVSPMFSRNVLREVRGLQQERHGILHWLRSHWQIPAVAACSIAVALALNSETPEYAQQQPGTDTDRLLVMAERVSESPDYLVISHLDELMDAEQNSLWLDSNVY
jgi:hypothetical protein